jgi:PIN domain nuclease of toxin-antitoxin system
VRILLDTQILLWAITEDDRFPERHRKLFVSPETELYFSMASVWEILIKHGIGKLPLPEPATDYLAKQLNRNQIAVMGIQMHHMSTLEKLADMHKDPFDRMIVAQAISERMPIMTSDSAFAAYPVKLV